MTLLVLRDGDLTIEVLPDVGGRLHRVRGAGRDLLRTPATVELHRAEPFFWGAFPMVPWCNRIPGGHLVFDDVDVLLPVNLDGDAIHGEGYDREWEVVDRSPSAATLRLTSGGPFPWRYSAEETFGVEGGVLTWRLGVRNDSATVMPAGVGIHPWFAAAGLTLRVPAERSYVLDGDKIPIGDPVPVSGAADMRAEDRPHWGFDGVLTDLTDAGVDLRWDGAVHARLAFSQGADHVTVAAFDDFGAVAVEPQTHATDGIGRLARGETGAAAALAPDQSLAVTFTLTIDT
ncbi:MAG TPA: hypothetical protein VHN98_09050 [Acidimicrobiales bacterium]|nr:hypothetical protein [Acidimicrobiales bacterium]